MKLTRKHLAFLTVILIVGITAFIIYQASNEKNHVQIYNDQGLMCPVNFRDPVVFSDFQLGWNNKTVWVRNVGDSSVEIIMVGFAPKKWVVTWNYNGSPIKPQETVKVTISIYAAYPMPVRVLPVKLEYKVLEG